MVLPLFNITKNGRNEGDFMILDLPEGASKLVNSIHQGL